MARPRKEGMDYFPHDVHLSTDKKVQALRIIHGNDGYTFYCVMLEMIYQEPNFELIVSDAETIQILAKNVEVTPQKFSEMLQTALKHGCFDRNRYAQDGVLTSDGIKKRAEVVVKKRESMRVSHDKKVSDGVSDAETTPESTQSKGKESKEKALKHIVDSDEPPSPKARFVKPTVEEVQAYCTGRNNGVDAEKWHDHYTAKGWLVGKTQMKDWKAAVRTWEKKDTVKTGQAASAQIPAAPTETVEDKQRRLQMELFGGVMS